MSEGIWNGINVTKEFIKQIHDATKTRQYQNDKFPFVKGHPKDDDPAYGWGEKENIFIDGKDGHLKLKTTEDNYQPEFLEQLKKKLFGPLSIKLRPEDLSVKHIGFFGAVPTAVTNLEPAFSEGDKKDNGDECVELLFKKINYTENDETIVLEFAELEVSRYQQRSAYTIFRNLKNHFISALGLDTANKIMPEDLLADINEPLKVYDPNPKFGFKENFIPQKNKDEDTMDLTQKEIDELKAKAAKADALEAENTKLKDEINAFEEKLEFSEAEKKLNAAHQFCESEDVKKKLTPVLQKRVANLIASLDNEESILEFKEDKKDVKVKPTDVIKELIGMLPDIEFAEIAKNGKGEESQTDKEYNAGVEAAKRLNGEK
jgi:hypothetical protein